jgi:hypothetical protein
VKDMFYQVRSTFGIWRLSRPCGSALLQINEHFDKTLIKNTNLEYNNFFRDINIIGVGMGIIVIDRTIKSIAILLTIINLTITNIRVVFVFSLSVLLVSLLKKRYKILGKGTLHISSTNNVCSIPRVVLNGLMLFCILYVGFCVTKKIN